MFMCDLAGMREPEIVKVRPVVIISPRLPYRSGLVTIVPISLSPPRHEVPYNYKLSKNYNPLESDDLDCWAKCDLVMNLSLTRLDSFKVGRRKWETPTILPHDLRGIRVGVLYGLGMGHLIIHAESAI